jgi:hypothetical protein
MIAYCLLPNHYHFLVRQNGDETAGLLPQKIFNGYTKALNKRYSRTGTLFEGRYKAIHVDKEGYLLHLCRYIHANPIRHNLVTQLNDWPFSNYLEWVKLRKGTLIDYELVQEHFSTPQQYIQFVESYLNGIHKLPDGIEPYLLG